MIKTRSKKISLLLVLMMLATMFVGVGTASAASINRVDKVVAVDDDYTGAPSTLTIKEDDDFPTDFTAGDSFLVTLPAGVNWDSPGSLAVTLTDVGADLTLGTGDDVTINMLAAGNGAVVSSDQTLDITFPAGVTARVDVVTITLGIEVDTFSSGDITATVDALDSGVTSGTYVFARVLDGTTTAKALSVETIGDNGNGGDLRVEESAIGAIGDGIQSIEFRLPSHFDWDVADVAGSAAGDPDFLFAFSGGLAGMAFTENGTISGAGMLANNQWNATVDGDKLTLIFDPPNSRNQRGIITVDTPINPDNDANYGDVEVSISGTECDDADVVVAKYSDYGVEITVDEVKDINAGKYAEELETITIEETVPGTFVDERDIHFEFPSWVKITDVTANASGGGLTIAGPTVAADTGDVDGTSNELDVTVTNATTGTTGKIEIDFEISVEGNKTGDIELIVNSKNAGVPETKLVVGKAVGSVTATSDGSKDIKIGLQAQEISDITIAEGEAGAISDDNESAMAENIFLTLPQGAKFEVKPKVEVIEGNVDLDEDSLDLVTNVTNDDRLVIPVSSSSTKASKIKVSGIKVTVDRTVPEGDFKISLGGGALIENQLANTQGWLNGAIVTAGATNTSLDEGEFDTGTVLKVVAGKVVTPAPGEVTNNTVFTFGSTTYKLNGVDKTMDVAPYAKDNRTYMPIRYVAYALGITDANILWDQANSTVTLMKGDKVVQMKLGSTALLVNGATITMDVAPEAASDRIMLPAALVAQAFGQTATYDAATQTVTIK